MSREFARGNRLAVKPKQQTAFQPKEEPYRFKPEIYLSLVTRAINFNGADSEINRNSAPLI